MVELMTKLDGSIDDEAALSGSRARVGVHEAFIGDGDMDLICGEIKGRIVTMRNNNGSFENVAFLKDKDNNEIDVEELMYLTDSRKFLQQSKYKPTK